MKVALVYDRVNKWGGAERVLLELHKLFPNAPLYTSVYNPKKAPWAKVFDVRTSFLQKFPFASSMHEKLAIFMPLAFESFHFDQYDVVISITSEAAKNIITKPHTLHICYCLTPTRYLWSSYEDYFKNSFLRFFAKPFVRYLRKADVISSSRPSHYIAISKEVQKRIKKYYGKSSVVIYPPVSLMVDSGLRKEKNKKPISNKLFAISYFLVVSRFVPYKRIDIAIGACSRLGLRLKIVGSGSEEKRLRKISGKTIEFFRDLTDSELGDYYKNCRALLFPGSEDFGLSIVEAHSFGKPVIAFGAGGAAEIIEEGKTGSFFSPQTSEALQRVLEEFGEIEYNAKDAIKNAKRFSQKYFEKEFVRFIQNYLND